jgi:hypothetical protein
MGRSTIVNVNRSIGNSVVYGIRTREKYEMNILIITYRLPNVDEEALRARFATVAPVFLQVPGLLGKVWLADSAEATYGGVYAFTDHAALDAFLASEIVAGLRAMPGIVDVTMRAFDAVEATTRVTQGVFALYSEAVTA